MRVDCAQVKNEQAADKNLDGQTSFSCTHEKILDYLDKCPAALVTQAISQVFIGVTPEDYVESYSIILIKTLKASQEKFLLKVLIIPKTTHMTYVTVITDRLQVLV